MSLQKARILEWNPAKGFGWLQVGGKRVFLHIRDFAERHKQPEAGDVVQFQMGRDAKGRACAKQAVHVNDGGRLTWADWLIVAGLLLLPGIALTYWDWDWRKTAPVFAAISGVTYIAYAHDKRRARSRGWRVAEATLHLLEALGGWPGAFLAQRRLRHKCSKLGYQLVFWFIVLVWQFIAFESLNDWRILRSLRGMASPFGNDTMTLAPLTVRR